MKPSLLFVSARLPFPCTEGHQLRSFGVLSQLAQQFDVHLLSLLRPGETIDHHNALGQVCRSITGVAIPHSLLGNASAALRGFVLRQPLVVAKYVTPSLRRAFVAVQQQHKPQLIHFDLLPLAELSNDIIGATPWGLNEHNVESDLIEQKIATVNGLAQQFIYRREWRYLQRFEQAMVQKANLVLACSDDDGKRLQQWGARNISTIPNGVDAQRLQPNNTNIDQSRVVFLGGMNWYPNRLGMQWFVHEVLPLLVQRHPDVCVDLIGNPEPAIDIPPALTKHVNRLGFVPDFVPYVQKAAAMIVPLHVGSGTRLKVVEGLALGKCMVSTRKGAEGVGLTHERNILFADNADDFANTVSRVLRDPALRQSIEQQARRCADEVYDWHIIGKRLRQNYAALGNNSLV